MSLDEERLARVSLSRAVEPGDPRTAALVRQLGPCQALEALHRRAARGEGDIAPRAFETSPEHELAEAEKRGLRFVVPDDEEWPSGFADLGHAMEVQGLGGVPVGLWVRGPLRLRDATPAVAVVGSRSATSYGLDQAARLAADLALADCSVVSGAAFGIDKAAHVGTLAVNGATVAVLACGLDRAYPAAHADLIERIAERGAVVSEVPPGMEPTRVRFLARNRLIAAMSVGTVVVEAALRSGALNTAHWAEQMSRHVMGVPGPVTSASSQGVHELLRRGGVVVSRAEHVLELVRPAGQDAVRDPRGPTRGGDALDTRARQLLDATPPGEALSLASVAEAAAMQIRHAARGLERLAAQGLVVEEGRGCWRRVNPAGT